MGLAAPLLALSNATAWGWTSPWTIGLLIFGAFVLTGWVRFERHRDDPLVDISVLASPEVLRTNVATLLLGYGVFGSFFLLPLLLQLPSNNGGLGMTATQAGLMAMPVAVTNVVVSPLIGVMSRSLGPKPAVVSGCTVGTLTMVLVALLPASTVGLLTASILWGVAFGAGMAAVSSLIIYVVEDRYTGEASAMNLIIRNVGSAVGAQVGAAVITLSRQGGHRSLRSRSPSRWPGSPAWSRVRSPCPSRLNGDSHVGK
jgi:predicted MFS family arabinose efflux permease